MGIIRNIPYSGSSTADGTGAASVVFNGPPSGFIELSSIAVEVTPSTPIPTATLYEGSIFAPGRIMAILRAGDRGTFRGDDGDRLNAGQQITVVWAGAAAGAVCRAVLRGRTVQP